MKTTRKSIYGAICTALPYFCSLIYGLIPQNIFSMQVFLKKYTIFLLMFMCWYGVRRTFMHLQNERRSTGGSGRSLLVLKYAALIVLLTVTMTLLQIFKTNFGQEAFVTALSCMFTIGLTDSFLRLGYGGSAVLTRFISAFGLSFLTFQIIAPSWSAAAICFSAGIALLVTAVFIAELAEQGRIRITGINSLLAQSPEPDEDSGKLRKGVTRIKRSLALLPRTGFALIYSLCLFMSPMLIVALTVFSGLPRYFCFVCVCLPFCAGQANAAQNASENKDLPESFSRDTSGICLLFVVIIILLGLW